MNKNVALRRLLLFLPVIAWLSAWGQTEAILSRVHYQYPEEN